MARGKEKRYCFRCGGVEYVPIEDETNHRCPECGVVGSTFTLEAYLDIMNDLYLKGMLDEYLHNDNNEIEELNLSD
jgi:hypothetical protein